MDTTCFASAPKKNRRKLKNQINTISNSPIMNTLLSIMGGVLVIVNEDRQLVAINHIFLESIGITNPQDVLGLRLGDSLHCIHADESPHGCGTTPYCGTCGAAISLMTAINEDKIDEQICALTATKDGEPSDRCLLIRAQPLNVEGKRWVLVFAQDITQQQMWANMERIFFHDVSNTINGLYGFSQLLTSKMPENMEARRILEATERLCGEIASQRLLFQHKDAMCLEDAMCLAQKRHSPLAEIRNWVSLIVQGHQSAKKKQITEHWPEEPVLLYTDPLLLSRILGNMMINALESSEEGATVRFTTKVEPSEVLWEVWNDCFIPKDVSKRIFQKHFSTKAGSGRGLGTYSMKFFGEKYLHGKISMSSSPEEGTTFSFRLPRP